MKRNAQQSLESMLKLLLRWFGGFAVIAAFPFVMPQRWMALTHEWLGMGVLPDQPVVEYLARTTSALFAIYGGLLLILATDVQRYGRVITYQAAVTLVAATVGAVFGWRAGMPAWWMIGDLVSCWLFCGAMLVVQQRIARLEAESEATESTT